MKYSVIAAAALLAACGSCAHGGVQDHPNTTDVPAVVRLMVTDEDGDTRFACTAWKVGDGLVATAGHCCRDEVTYTLDGPGVVKGAEARIIVDLYDPDKDSEGDKDVCIMKGEVRGEPIRLAAKDPQVGSHIWTVGYPDNIFLISEGIWSGRDEENFGITSSVVRPGASGSPVMNAKGEAVGVLVRFVPNMRSGGDSITKVAPIEKLRLALRKARALKNKPPADIDED